MSVIKDHKLLTAARTLVVEHFGVQPGECVLISADTHTDPAMIDAVFGAAALAGATPMVVTLPQLPFQGALADRWLPDAFAAAVARADVWFDFNFPYAAGSTPHDAAIKAGRVRYALLALPDAASFTRLYGGMDFAALMDFQVAFAEYLDGKAGSEVHFTCPRGSDARFILQPIKLKRHRVANVPGIHTVPGAQSLYPEMQSVRGRIVLQALFDEIYRPLRQPITLEVDGRIQGFHGALAEDAPRLERALRRAGNGEYGYFIHFTLGFHPATRFTGTNFIEDIRLPGTNAIGMGLPWWEPGGGENHPDGVVFDQTLTLNGEVLMKDGRLVAPPALRALHERLVPRFY